MAVLNTACGTPYERARYGPRFAAIGGGLLLFVVWRTELSIWHGLGGLPSWWDGDALEQLQHHHLTFDEGRCTDLFASGNSPRLPRLQKLDLSRCGFSALPTHFPWEQLRDLSELDASDNQLSLLPDGLEGLPKLRILLLGTNRFEAVPPVVRTLPALEVLGMQGNALASLGEGELPAKLTQLLLSDNSLRAIPDSISRLHSLRRLELSGNDLEQMPAHLSNLASLEALGLAGNRLRARGGLPAELFRLPRLSWLTLAANQWPLPKSVLAADHAQAPTTRTTAALAAGRQVAPKMEASRIVDAASTPVVLLHELSPAAAAGQVGRAFANSASQYRLYDATLAGEPVLLKVFKASAQAMRLAKEEALIHEWIGPHENLEGVSGVVTHLNVSAEAFVAMHAKLSAPNVRGGAQQQQGHRYSTTHSGDSQDPSGSSGSGSSGGSADQAMMQSTALLLRRPAGASRGTVGKDTVEDTADWMAAGVGGLRPLADHPTILKPLRSQYPRRRRFSLGFILRVLRGVCAALEHLHEHQISHGALAAHRVLVDGEQLSLREHGHEHNHIIEMSHTGPVILIDLSAAFSYATASPAATLEVTADAAGAAGSAAAGGGGGGSSGDFERLEVRSFGLLLEQLCTRYDARRAIDDQGVVDTDTKRALEALAKRATAPMVSSRPTFVELGASLRTIEKEALPEGDWYQHTHETIGSPSIAG
jgi:hypothetical protein